MLCFGSGFGYVAPAAYCLADAYVRHQIHRQRSMAQVLQQPGHCAGAFQQSRELHSGPRVDSRSSDLAKPRTRNDPSGAQLATSAEFAGPLPTFDLTPILNLSKADRSAGQAAWPAHVQQLCQAVAKCLHDTGCLIVRDPRVKAEDNTAFLDMMERYFEQDTASKLEDSRPQLHFQVSKACCAVICSGSAEA